MTEKTIAERLREVNTNEWCNGLFISKVLNDKEASCKDLYGEIISCSRCTQVWANKLADAIEAEQRSRTEQNGLPEGIIWPRFEDGELVKVGDKVQHDGETKEVARVLFYKTRTWIRVKTETCYEELEYLPSKPLKRHEPEVLDADGVPIKVDDTVYGQSDGKEWQVVGFAYSSEHSVVTTNGKSKRELRPEWLTHRKPDTLEAIEDDATVPAATYCVRRGLIESDTCVDDATLLELHILDLLRRQRNLLGGE